MGVTHAAYVYYMLGKGVDFNIFVMALPPLFMTLICCVIMQLSLKTSEKIKQLVNPFKRNSYNVLSVMILRSVQVNLFISVILTLMRITFLCMGTSYGRFIKDDSPTKIVYLLISQLGHIS